MSRIEIPKWTIEVKPVPPVIEPWKWIVLTIAQEALNESFKGKVAVAEVIRERIETKFNSDGTVEGTVLMPLQFSGWNHHTKYRIQIAQIDLSHPLMLDCIRAYETAFTKRTNYALGANLYHADYMNPYPPWTESPRVARLIQIERHIFYKETR